MNPDHTHENRKSRETTQRYVAMSDDRLRAGLAAVTLIAQTHGLTCPHGADSLGMNFETRTRPERGRGFGFEAGGRLPQASDDDWLRRPR